MTEIKKPVLRFAPSPTGYLHIGGARTALFHWLYARPPRIFAYRGGAGGAVNRAPPPPQRRHLPAPDRGHRPPALNAGSHRRHSGGDALARPRLGRPHQLSLRPRRAPPPERRAIAGARQGLSLLCAPSRARRDAGEAARGGQAAAL